MSQNLAIYGDKIVLLSKYLRSGGQSISNIPYLIKQIIENEMWKKFLHPSASQLIDNSDISFIEFILSPPPKGLGSDLKTFENILFIQTRSNDSKDSTAASDALDVFISELKVHGLAIQPEPLPESIVENSQESFQRKKTAKYYAMRRLQRDRPDLYECVNAGNISVNKAMVEAGFRPRRFSIRQDNISSAAGSLRSKLTPQQIEELVAILQAS